MNSVDWTFLFITLFIGTFLPYILHRNYKVLMFRVKMIIKCSEFDKEYNHKIKWREWYDNQPSYNTMMLKFWILDLNKILTESIEDYAKRKYNEIVKDKK